MTELSSKTKAVPGSFFPCKHSSKKFSCFVNNSEQKFFIRLKDPSVRVSCDACSARALMQVFSMCYYYDDDDDDGDDDDYT